MSGEDTRYHTSLAKMQPARGAEKIPLREEKSALLSGRYVRRITFGMTLELPGPGEPAKVGFPPWIPPARFKQRREGPL